MPLDYLDIFIRGFNWSEKKNSNFSSLQEHNHSTLLDLISLLHGLEKLNGSPPSLSKRNFLQYDGQKILREINHYWSRFFYVVVYFHKI